MTNRQFIFLTQLQLQILKNAQMDAVSQIFVDFLPVLSCFNTTNLNLYHYAGNNPVKYVDPDGRAPKNMIQEDREKYIQKVSDYKNYNRINNNMGIPGAYDCADVAIFIYGQAMSETDCGASTSNLRHGNSFITSIPQIQSNDFFTDCIDNITFYSSTAFDNEFVEVGTLMVWQAEEGANWTGHVATVVEVTRDEKVSRIYLNIGVHSWDSGK